jgi:hypothetical protein
MEISPRSELNAERNFFRFTTRTSWHSNVEVYIWTLIFGVHIFIPWNIIHKMTVEYWICRFSTGWMLMPCCWMSTFHLQVHVFHILRPVETTGFRMRGGAPNICSHFWVMGSVLTSFICELSVGFFIKDSHAPKSRGAKTERSERPRDRNDQSGHNVLTEGRGHADLGSSGSQTRMSCIGEDRNKSVKIVCFWSAAGSVWNRRKKYLPGWKLRQVLQSTLVRE